MASSTTATKTTRPFSLNEVLMSGGWKEARDAAYKLAETRPSLFPVLF